MHNTAFPLAQKTFTPFQLKNGLHTTNLRECRAASQTDHHLAHTVSQSIPFSPVTIMCDQVGFVTSCVKVGPDHCRRGQFRYRSSWTHCHTTHVSSSKSGPTQSSLGYIRENKGALKVPFYFPLFPSAPRRPSPLPSLQPSGLGIKSFIGPGFSDVYLKVI